MVEASTGFQGQVNSRDSLRLSASGLLTSYGTGQANATSDHLRVSGALNALGNDVSQLREQLQELSARLAEIMADETAEEKRLARPPMPDARCKMTAVVMEVDERVRECIGVVQSILARLEL